MPIDIIYNAEQIIRRLESERENIDLKKVSEDTIRMLDNKIVLIRKAIGIHQEDLAKALQKMQNLKANYKIHAQHSTFEKSAVPKLEKLIEVIESKKAGRWKKAGVKFRAVIGFKEAGKAREFLGSIDPSEKKTYLRKEAQAIKLKKEFNKALSKFRASKDSSFLTTMAQKNTALRQIVTELNETRSKYGEERKSTLTDHSDRLLRVEAGLILNSSPTGALSQDNIKRLTEIKSTGALAVDSSKRRKLFSRVEKALSEASQSQGTAVAKVNQNLKNTDKSSPYTSQEELRLIAKKALANWKQSDAKPG